MEVLVNKYEREVNHFGQLEYFYKVHRIPGGKVLMTFFVPTDRDEETAEHQVIADIHEYLKTNNLTALNKF